MKRGSNKIPPTKEELKAQKTATLKTRLFELELQHSKLSTSIDSRDYISADQLRIYRKARGKVWVQIKEVKKMLQLLN